MDNLQTFNSIPHLSAHASRRRFAPPQHERGLGRQFSIILISFLMILLSSCATHVRRNDGPPSFYVDETKIPNATPKPEALSKYGNMHVYYVFGKPYYTMKSSKHYEQVGIASWYGTKFNARRTSSGERYDMLGMTAAHKTLPLPTYVEVTNLKNHRKIIVKVNDRGPFSSNRLIDLSFVAAKKLGIVGHGTGLVKVKAIDPNTFSRPFFFADKHHAIPTYLSSSEQSSAHAASAFYLQVGAFRNKSHALKLQQQLLA